MPDPDRLTSPSSVSLVLLGLAAVTGVSHAAAAEPSSAGTPAVNAEATPPTLEGAAVPPLARPALTGYITSVQGATVIFSIPSPDTVHPGDVFSVLEYGEEIARLKVTTVSSKGIEGELIGEKPAAAIRRLDPVVPAASVLHPAADLAPPNRSTSADPHSREHQRRRRSRRSPQEIVSRADWSYPALSALAEHRLLPGVPVFDLHGDEQLTRDQVRGLVTSAAKSAADLPSDSRLSPDVRRWLTRLEREYDVDVPTGPAQRGFALSRVHRYRAATGDGAALSSSSVLQGMADLDRDTFAVVSLGRGRREWFGDRNYPWVNEAFAQSRWAGFDWTLGQRVLRWGPGYTGSLILGDTMPTLPMLRMQRMLQLGPLGAWNLDQFVSRFTESGKPKYLVGRRITHPIGSRIDLGLSETGKLDRRPNPTALVLPMLVYQRIYFKNSGTNNMNVQVDLDLSYRTGHHRAYGELFIDDITAPSPFRSQGPVPRKIGWLLGWNHEQLFGQSGTDLRVEYAAMDRNTTLHRNPSISLYDRGFAIGHPMGPNSQTILVRADRRVTPKLQVTGAVQWLDHPHPAPPNAVSDIAATLGAAYSFRGDRTLIVKVSPGRRVDRYDLRGRGGLEVIADWTF